MADNTAKQPGLGSRQEITARFVDLVNGLSVAIRPELLESWSEIELTMHEFRTLSLLSNGPQRVSDVASVLGVRFSSATNLIDRMEAKRLVLRLRDPVDRRVVWIRLTPLGRKQTESRWRISRQWLTHVSTLLTEQELDTVVRGLNVLSGAIDRENHGRAKRRMPTAKAQETIPAT